MLLTTNNNEFVGVILAGGHSKRMGKDKAKLLREQQTMIEFTTEQLLKAGASDVVVSSDKMYSNQYLTIADKQTGKGPLMGMLSTIMSTLSANPSRNYLFVPVDMPFLNHLALAKLANTAIKTGYATSVSHCALPLFLTASNQVIELLSAIVESEKTYKVAEFIEEISTLSIAVENKMDWFNVDTPSQWSKAKTYLTRSQN